MIRKNITTAELVEMSLLLDRLSNEELLDVRYRLRSIEWPEELGSAPEGFKEMGPEEKVYHTQPWTDLIDCKISRKSLARYIHTHELGESEEQFEDWWQSEIYTMLENIQWECESKKTGEPPDDIKMVLQKDAAKKREQVRKDCKKYLKYTVCSLFGLSVFLLSESLLGGLVLLGLFILRILLEE